MSVTSAVSNEQCRASSYLDNYKIVHPTNYLRRVIIVLCKLIYLDKFCGNIGVFFFIFSLSQIFEC